MNRKIKVFSGNTSRPLAGEVCKLLSIEPGLAEVVRFNDGEVRVQIQEDVRGTDVFIVNSTEPPAENFIEAGLLVEAAHDASAGRITLVIPYLGYNRQDRKDRSRVPISAGIMIDFLSRRGADRVLLFDLHSEPTMGYFKPMVVDHLYGSKISVPYISELARKYPFVVASPDKGGGPRAEAYARLLGQDDFIFFFKSRRTTGEVRLQSIKIVGSIEGKNVFFVDDIIDTAGTIVSDAAVAKEAGAKDIYVIATHALFSGDAIKRISDSSVKEVVVTNTICHDTSKFTESRVKITSLSIAPLLGEAIRRIHEGESLSSLILRA